MICDLTERDIDGAGHTCRTCPLARAITRAIGRPASVSRVAWSEPLGPDRPLPDDMRRWLEAYDRGEPVGPATFELPFLA